MTPEQEQAPQKAFVCAACSVSLGLETVAGGPKVTVIRGIEECALCKQPRFACREYPEATVRPGNAEARKVYHP